MFVMCFLAGGFAFMAFAVAWTSSTHVVALTPEQIEQQRVSDQIKICMYLRNTSVSGLSLNELDELRSCPKF